MKSTAKIFSKWIAYGLLFLLILFLVVTSLSQYSGYKDSLKERAGERAEALLKEDNYNMLDAMGFMTNELTTVADALAEIPGEQETFYYLEALTYHDEHDDPNQFKYVKMARAFLGSREYTSRHQEYNSEAAEVLATRGSKSMTLIGIVTDLSSGMDLLAYYTPVLGNAHVDGVVLFYNPEVFKEFSGIGLNAKGVSLSAIKKDGLIETVIDGSFITETGTQLYDYFKSINLDETTVDSVRNLLDSGKEGTVQFSYQGISYVLTTSQLGSEHSTVYLVGIYNVEDLYDQEFTFFNTSSALLILFVVILFAFFMILFVRFLYINYYEKREYLDPVYHLPTRTTFLLRAGDILLQNKKTKFAVVSGQIRFFKYITDMDNSPAKTYIINIGKLIKKSLLSSGGETYCYDMDGRFYFMMHYVDFDEVIKRINRINEIAGRVKIDADKKLMLGYGIARSEDFDNAGSQRLMDCALEALRHTESHIGLLNYSVYDPNKFEECMDKDFIEMNMEAALEAGNFKVFYQPKYSMIYNHIDGSEALVRWYMPDENRFYPPATFLPVIENNGFIVKVDHYVFEQVCVYIRESLNIGRKVYPVSVNVSRMTVEQPDFVDYYVAIKRKYKIRDGLLAIEFTESADYEDYENMAKSVAGLHAGGFLCSIDDFGTGYSSYNCLKMLPMDEIKLDRFFLKIGQNRERDDDVLRSLIALGKQLKMKVTQEGVSSQEDYDRLKGLGCETMQGFLYAKPMPLEDYISFTTNEMPGRFE